MLGTRGRIALLFWAAVTIQLICDQAAAKDAKEDSGTDLSPAETASNTTIEGDTYTKAVVVKGDINSLQLGKPVDSEYRDTGAKAPGSGQKLILVTDPTGGTITRLTSFLSDDLYLIVDYSVGFGTRRPKAVDYDKTEDYIYWTSVNGAFSAVGRFPYASSRLSTLLDGQEASEPEGIAVDVISRNLYWTDAGTNRIIVSRLDGSFRKTLITQGLDKPRAIVVDPNAGWMYWIEWGTPPTINRARMDGTQTSVIVNIGQSQWPTGLALDASANRLYWCNRGTGQIWTSGVTGSIPRRVFTHTDSSLSGIAVDEKYLYWTATNDPGVHRIIKSTLRGYDKITRFGQPLNNLQGIVVRTTRNTPSQPNACSTSNGNCAQLCLPVPGGGRTCACQDGWGLESDGTSCQDLRFRTSCQEVCPWSDVTGASCVDGFCACSSENDQQYTCLPKCPTLTAPVNGALSPTGATNYLDVVTFTCNRGYVLNGASDTWCQHNGTWNNAVVPTCTPRQCPTLTAPANGLLSPAGPHSYQDAVTFSCNSGYRLYGASSVTCQADGTWSGPVPICTVPCPTLTAPGNGTLRPTRSNSYRDRVTFSCNPGYIRNGAYYTTCQADGTWSNAVPTCTLRQCPTLTAPANGVLSPTGANSYQDVVTFSCYSGYQLYGASSVTCQANGRWNEPVPMCTVPCPTLTAPANGTLSSTGSNSYRDRVTFTCNRGYVRNGPSYATCQADGTWSNPVPTCPPRQCPTLTAPANGVLSPTGANSYQDEVTFSCNSGYQLYGASSVTCQADGRWSGPVPICTVPCPTLTAPANGTLSSTGSNSYQDRVSFSCNPGYVRNGAYYTTCQADGTWSNAVPTCTRFTTRSVAASCRLCTDVLLWALLTAMLVSRWE